MSEPHVVVLGGGPAGCGAAYRLRRADKARVTLVERGLQVGGNAGSFEAAGQHLDFGSHRLHPACDAEVLQDIRAMLGGDLALRERRGRIRLRGRWLQFPLKTSDLLLRLDRRFALGVMRDMVRGALPGKSGAEDSFAAVLQAGLGATLCEQFYFPYARKLWGLEPETLSAIQANKRVSAASVVKILKRLVRPSGGGQFHYPRRGFGQITEAYAREASRGGAELLLGWTVTRVGLPQGGTDRFSVELTNPRGELRTLQADHVWSTIPVTVLCRMISPALPDEVLAATGNIAYRSMILVYLTLPVDRFTPTDAHYFPESQIRITRLSEPKNYFGGDEPRGTTTLCAELPCQHGDEYWNMPDEDLGQLVLDDMAAAGLPLHEPLQVFTRRLPQAYPIYTIGYERQLEVVDHWLHSIPNLLTYGRQGLFAHDNTHHALYMAYAAVDCLRGDGSFDMEKWADYRRIFATHVVED